MLALFVFQLLVCVICLFTGFLMHKYVLTIFPKQGEQAFKPIIVYLVSGLITITAVCQWIILFHPLTDTVKIIIGILLVACILLKGRSCLFLLRHLISKLLAEPVILAGICLTCILVLILNSGPTMMDDTESYHIQMVKWIEEWGSVPGLVNLHERYGFNSSWFTSIAFFNLPGKGLNFYTALNGTISLWFAGYLLSGTGKIFANDTYRSAGVSIACLLIFIISMVAWPLIRGNASTANYDFITTVAVFVLFCETLVSILKNGKVSLSAEWIIWPVYIFTVRIINYPFLLLTLYGLLTLVRERKLVPLAVHCLFALLLLTPFLIRNIILSGYLFYPSLNFDWFNTDWKAGKEKTLELLRFIKYFNRVNAGIQNIEVTASLNFPQWVFAWFRHMFWYDKLITVTGLAGLFTGIIFLKRLARRWNAFLILFLFVLAIQYISWFLIAPDPRFIYGSLLCGILLTVAVFNEAVRNIRWMRIVKPVLFLTIASLPLLSLFKISGSKDYRSWILPTPLADPPSKTVVINNTLYHIPEKINNNWNPRCYETALPCIYEMNPRLEMRGKDLGDGFKIEK